LLDNEVNLSIDTISQMNLYALVDSDGSTAADDENTPGTNAARGRNWRSLNVDCGWCGAFVRGVSDRCGSVVDRVGRRTGSGVPGICADVGAREGVRAFDVRRGAVDLV
jgi:hypothetical protein